jgi:ADP-heptose:LPS heptosyltransferase
MKILVISLLRLGDFIQAAPVIAGLKQKYPGARLDVLVHSPVARLQKMMPVVDRWHTLNREELQEGLGRADIPLLTSFHVLREQCEALSAEQYDWIVNLTHTEFSGWIAGYIPARNKLGLAFSARGQAAFHSPWFRYLNERASGPVTDILNYTDIFAQACELNHRDMIWPLTPSLEGEREVDALELPGGERVTVQALTSDSKKNWGVSRWVQWFDTFMEQRSNATVVLLGAPNERETLLEIRAGCAHFKRVRVAILSLDGALALLNRSDLLVTCDTSIKHLANAASCRVMELSLGSSDSRRTGIYKPGSLIVEPAVPCAPCPHSSPCSQSSHVCAQALIPTTVARAADFFMSRDLQALKALPLSLKQTRILNTGFWFAEPVAAVDAAAAMEVWLERSAHRFLLSGAEKNAIPAFGTEVYHLSEELARLMPSGGFSPLVARLDFLEQELSERGHACAQEKAQFQPARNEPLVDLAGLRARQNRIEDERREVEIKSKLIRSLRTRLAEFK